MGIMITTLLMAGTGVYRAYFKHLLSVLPEHIDKDGNIDPSVLDTLMPWSKTLPEECYKRR